MPSAANTMALAFLSGSRVASHRAGKTAVIECVPEQTATRHIAEKKGFAYVGRTDGLEVYRLPPNE